MGQRSRTWLAAISCFGLLVSCSTMATPPQTSSQMSRPTPTQTQHRNDFTVPGSAQKMVFSLIAASQSTYVLGVEIRQYSVTVAVLKSGKAETWAYRNGEILRVPSDIQYVRQARVPVESFNIADVGVLFRSAAAISGSAQEQLLSIIDYSGGEIAMTVTTVPETRPVFFNPDGTPLASLDFTAKDGIAAGIKAVVKDQTQISSLGINSSQGVWIDYPGPDGTTLRRTRAAIIPPTVAGRKETPATLFSPETVSLDTIWRVYQELLAKDPIARNWSVSVEIPRSGNHPVMKFIVGKQSLTTSIDGKPHE